MRKFIDELHYTICNICNNKAKNQTSTNKNDSIKLVGKYICHNYILEHIINLYKLTSKDYFIGGHGLHSLCAA